MRDNGYENIANLDLNHSYTLKIINMSTVSYTTNGLIGGETYGLSSLFWRTSKTGVLNKLTEKLTTTYESKLQKDIFVNIPLRVRCYPHDI